MHRWDLPAGACIKDSKGHSIRPCNSSRTVTCKSTSDRDSAPLRSPRRRLVFEMTVWRCVLHCRLPVKLRPRCFCVLVMGRHLSVWVAKWNKTEAYSLIYVCVENVISWFSYNHKFEWPFLSQIKTFSKAVRFAARIVHHSRFWRCKTSKSTKNDFMALFSWAG